tara:strand:+ start:3438 stop:4940 length:1503 start_codon:yes stop_codon:yes gene_type:complete
MGAVIEVKYFNTFVLRKIIPNAFADPNGAQTVDPAIYGSEPPVWNGSYGIPAAKGGYGSQIINNTAEGNWILEESRIRGGFNNTSVSFGAKAYLVEEEPNGSVRSNALIYSGIFNSRTGINNTNVFPVGEQIEKGLDPANGSIQKLYAEDTNLTIFQELKLSRALIDKDAIYSAEGSGTAVSQLNLVIGQITPIYGEYGISKDPQSFAVYGANKYFTDKNNSVVLKLAGAQLQEISKANMVDYFRDRLSEIDVGSIPGTILGGWDIYNKQYVLSTQQNNAQIPSFDENYATLSWDESIQGWTSFFTYKPDHMISLQNKYYTVKDGIIYRHYNPVVSRNLFYNSYSDSSITFVFNPEVTSSKNFQTVEYEGSNGWEILRFQSDATGQDPEGTGFSNYIDETSRIYSYLEGKYDSQDPPQSYPNAIIPPFFYAGFNRKENKYTANIINNSSTGEGEVVFGAAMSGIKGYLATVTISTDGVTDLGGEKELFSVGSKYARNNGY